MNLLSGEGLRQKHCTMTSPAPTLVFDLGGMLARHDALYDRLAACFADAHDTRPKVTARLGGDRGGR